MTEINIRRKSSNPILWAIMILALLVVVWLLLGWGLSDPALTSIAPGSEALALFATPASAPWI